MSTTNDAPDRASLFGIEQTAPEQTGVASAHCAPASGSAPSCACANWCRTDIAFRDGKPLPTTNHHPNCPHVDDSLIDVWRVSYDGQSYVIDHEPTQAHEEIEGCVVTKERMHREIYENLPDFQGF